MCGSPDNTNVVLRGPSVWHDWCKVFSGIKIFCLTLRGFIQCLLDDLNLSDMLVNVKLFCTFSVENVDEHTHSIAVYHSITLVCHQVCPGICFCWHICNIVFKIRMSEYVSCRWSIVTENLFCHIKFVFILLSTIKKCIHSIIVVIFQVIYLCFSAALLVYTSTCLTNQTCNFKLLTC